MRRCRDLDNQGPLGFVVRLPEFAVAIPWQARTADPAAGLQQLIVRSPLAPSLGRRCEGVEGRSWHAAGPDRWRMRMDNTVPDVSMCGFGALLCTEGSTLEENFPDE